MAAKKAAKKPGPKPRPVNLNDLIRHRALTAAPPSADDIQALLISLLYDTPEDNAEHGGVPRGRLKLDILMSLHRINVDQRPPDAKSGSDLDAQLLTILAARQQRKLQGAAEQDKTEPKDS